MYRDYVIIYTNINAVNYQSNTKISKYLHFEIFNVVLLP